VPVVNSDEQLLAVLETLEECRAALLDAGTADTAHMVSVAILDLRMKLNRIADSELKAMCEEIMRSDGERAARRKPLLRVVK
jgi:hypothetical protein